MRQYDWAAVTLALTAAGDDEKPLLVRMESDTARITAIGPKAAPSELATAGIYAVRPSILREAESAQRDGLDSLRAFLGRLMERGYKLAGIPISQSIDVDRPTDIGVAEAFLNNMRQMKRLLGIFRERQYSPGRHLSNDALLA